MWEKTKAELSGRIALYDPLLTTWWSDTSRLVVVLSLPQPCQPCARFIFVIEPIVYRGQRRWPVAEDGVRVTRMMSTCHHQGSIDYRMVRFFYGPEVKADLVEWLLSHVSPRFPGWAHHPSLSCPEKIPTLAWLAYVRIVTVDLHLFRAVHRAPHWLPIKR